MDAFRTSLIQTADDIALALQNAGRTFGFLADGRDLVVTSGDGESRIASFPDHSDEGWPEVSVPLPPDAEFAYAAMGPLTRVARWKIAHSEAGVLEGLSAMSQALRFQRRSGGGAVATLESNATLKVRGVTSGMTLLSFEQTRQPDTIRAAIRKRARR